MYRKAQPWLSNLMTWGQRRQTGTAEKLYAEAICQARQPAYFDRFGVADDVDGRFDMLSLVVALIMRRLRQAGEPGRVLSQQLFDTMFADMDLSLREMGAGDIGVSKRVRWMAEAFMGRLDAYVVAVDAADRAALSAALTRNLFRGKSDIDPLDNGLVDAIFELVGQLDRSDDAVLLDGRITAV